MKKEAQQVHPGVYRPKLIFDKLVLVDAFPDLPAGMRGMTHISIPPPKRRWGIFVLVGEKEVVVQYFYGEETPQWEESFPVARNQHGRSARPIIQIRAAGKVWRPEYPVRIVPRPSEELSPVEAVLDGSRRGAGVVGFADAGGASSGPGDEVPAIEGETQQPVKNGGLKRDPWTTPE